MVTTLARHLFTVRDYARMRESGILSEDARVELLNGEVLTMSAIGPRHVGIVNKLSSMLFRFTSGSAIVSVQNPIQLDEYSEPQPDIALLHPRDDYYAHALATPDDVLLVIEIADSSLEYDREEKLPRYAQALIGEVWIVDVNKRIVEQYTEPSQGQYTQLRTVLLGNTITATAVSNVVFEIDTLFDF